MQADDVKVGGVMDGGAPLLLPACMFLRTLERARTLPARRCVDGRGASFAASAVEVLKASGAPGTRHVTVRHPGDLWTCHGEHTRAAPLGLGFGGWVVIKFVYVMTEG